MKTKCTLVGSILSIISNGINAVANGIISFVLLLVIGIGSSLSGEKLSTLEINLILLSLLIVMLTSILSIIFSSILIVKRKNKVLTIRILLLVFTFLSILFNMILVCININSLIFIAFASFALVNISIFILILVDSIKNRKKLLPQQNTFEKQTIEEK